MTHDIETHTHDTDPPSKRSRKGMSYKRWTKNEIIQLRLLYARGIKRYDIAKKLDMPEDRIRQRLQWEASSGTILTARARRRAAQRLVTKDEQKSARVFFERVEPLHRPPEEALIERCQRMAAPPRDIAGLLMGDPPVGFSALERRT